MHWYLPSFNGSFNEPSEWFNASLESDTVNSFFPLWFPELYCEQCLTECLQMGLHSRPEPHQMAKLTSSVQPGINHTCGQKNGQLGCCLCFPNGTGVMGAELPALGHSRMERQDTCVLGSQKSASRWCTRFISRLSVENVGCYHWQFSYQNLFNFLQIICMSTCWNTHPGKRWISLVQSCVHSTFSLVFSNCSPAAEQKLFWHQREHDRKSWRSGREKKIKAKLPAQRQSCLCNIHNQKYGKKGDSLQTSQTWLQVAQGQQLQGILVDTRVSRDPSQLPALPFFQRSNPSCASGGLTSSIHLQGRGKQAAIPWLHSSSPLLPSRSPVHSAAISSSNIQIKWFSMNLSGAPALLQATDWSAVGSAVSPCFGPSMPCPNPQRSYPTALCWQKGCLESLAAHSARKSAIHTLLKGE